MHTHELIRLAQAFHESQQTGGSWHCNKASLLSSSLPSTCFQVYELRL